MTDEFDLQRFVDAQDRLYDRVTKAYLAHPILGSRLRECTELMLAIEGRSVDQVFGYPDNLKFRSSMTLFTETAGNESLFRQALEKYFGGEPDEKTLRLLQ